MSKTVTTTTSTSNATAAMVVDDTTSASPLSPSPSLDADARNGLITDVGNMLKAFIGLNFMYVAYAFSNAGLLRGAVALICITLVTEHCCMLLIQVKNNSPLALPSSPAARALPNDAALSIHDFPEKSHQQEDPEQPQAQLPHRQNVSYGDIARVVGGPTVGRIINLALILTQFGFCVGYLIFLSQTLHDMIKSTHTVKWFVLIPLPVLMILALFSSIRSLGPFSLLANFALMVGFVSVVAFLAKHFQWQPSHPPITSFPLFFGQMTAALEGIGLVVPVEASMKNPERFPFVLRVALTFLSTVLMIVGILGFASFGEGTRSIILLNFGATPVVLAVKFVLMIGILFTYPLQIVPVFHYFERSLLPHDLTAQHSDESPDESSSTVSAVLTSGLFVSDWRRIGIRALIVLSTAAVAILAGGSFGLFQSLVGSLGATILAYCAPAVLHNIAFKDELSRLARMKNYALLVFGVIGGIVGAFTSVREILEIHKGNSQPL